MARHAAILIGLILLLAACGDDGPEPATADASVTPGGLDEGTVEIDGTPVDYVTVTPDGFEPGDAAPVLLALPPGGQDLDLTRTITTNAFSSEALRLGWVVVSPAAPNGTLYFNGSEALLGGFVDWIETWVAMEGGAPHVAGISNGGISSFRYAALHPDRVRSIVVFPGLPRSDDDRAALADLTDVPIRLYVGENDNGWVEAAQDTAATLEELGGDVELTVFAGEGHLIESTRDGVLVFEQLESFR